ncbi:hypothetical protein EJ02DRAFT_467622 [Clathrospora elynae]|uniref:Uncharacterized protein n=1 Tax=Clathrospora elynae TaxID=706981 RepID=A0A6A5SJR1_9PLEO|nr:hypothetical protein EJ02DRAFT_467622 [Clathrospora elynae]
MYSEAPSPIHTSGLPSPASAVSAALPPSRSSTTSPIPTAPPRFDASRMVIPSAAYAPQSPVHHPNPMASHMPVFPSRPPSVLQHLMRPDSITREMIFYRIKVLLTDSLPQWAGNTDGKLAIQHLTQLMVNTVIGHGRGGYLGPQGLSKVSNIFMCIGHEGARHYMCLAAASQWGDIIVFLKGELREKDGKDPMHDAEMMDMVQAGFDKKALQAYNKIKEGMSTKGRH